MAENPQSTAAAGEASPGPALASAAALVLNGAAIVGALLLAYAFFRFRSISEPVALLWYAVLIGVIVAGLRTARAAPAMRLGAALLCVAVALLLGLTEGVLQLMPRIQLARTRAAVSALSGRPFDAREIPVVIRDRRAAGEDLVPAIVPKVVGEFTSPSTVPHVRFDAPIFPLAGIASARTLQLCNEDGQFPEYHSDAHGFLNPAGTWDSLPADVVLIGDSFTNGYCVADDSSLAGSLRRRWPRTVNLGTGGSGPLAELATLVEYGLPAKPKLVLWFFFENDLEDLDREQAIPMLVRYRTQGYSQDLISRQPEIDASLIPWVDRLYASAEAPKEDAASGLRDVLLLGSTRRALRRLTAEDPPDPLAQLGPFRAVLADARARSEASGARLVFVFLPRWERFFGPRLGESDRFRQQVTDTARALGLPVIDVTHRFAADAEPARLFARGAITVAHYSPRGYGLVAKSVLDALDSLGIAPRPR